jgi:pimeloyl-ACP methyl ester carboxylesterase
MNGIHLIDGAGHVQQQQPARFNALLLDFLRQSKSAL